MLIFKFKQPENFGIDWIKLLEDWTQIDFEKVSQVSFLRLINLSTNLKTSEF
jgi:hypothetical protein